jgi:hypothetical protein
MIPNFPDNFVHILCATHEKSNVASIVHACEISKPVHVILKSRFAMGAHSCDRNVSADAIREIPARMSAYWIQVLTHTYSKVQRNSLGFARAIILSRE